MSTAVIVFVEHCGLHLKSALILIGSHPMDGSWLFPGIGMNTVSWPMAYSIFVSLLLSQLHPIQFLMKRSRLPDIAEQTKFGYPVTTICKLCAPSASGTACTGR